MKITLKTLKQQTFVVEVDVETDTVRSLKEKLNGQSGQAYPVDRQRLIYLGKIMEDDHPLRQYNLDDKKFIVVMSKKPTPVAAGDGAPDGGPTADASDPKPATASTTQAGAQAKDTSPVVPPADSESATATSTVTTAAQNNPSTTPSASNDQQQTPDDSRRTDKETAAPSTDAIPQEMQVNIQRLKEMGYSEQSARIALEICANIPDRAVEYLLSEGGASLGSLGAAPVSMPMAVGSQAGGAASPATATGDANPLAFLRNNPVFQDMKRILREDPALLPYLMRRIQASNPDLLETIAENQEEFLALINEGAPSAAPQGMSQELEEIAAAMVNSLTPSDMDAIERLKALGYPEHLVIQAYIACERDEYNAAEFLVSQTLDEEE